MVGVSVTFGQKPSSLAHHLFPQSRGTPEPPEGRYETNLGGPRASGRQIRARGSATPGSHEARLQASSWPPCSPSIPDSQREPDLPRHAGPGHDTRLRPAPLGPQPCKCTKLRVGKRWGFCRGKPERGLLRHQHSVPKYDLVLRNP